MKEISLFLTAFLLALSQGYGEENRTAFRVQLYSLGSEASQRDPRAGNAAFVSRLDGRPAFAAREEKTPPRSTWDDPLPEGKPDEKIALVAVHFGARTDWLAFGFDAKGDPVVAVRRPARQYDTQGIFPENIPPGDRQIDRNAGIELAADFGWAWTGRTRSISDGVPVSLRLAEAEESEGMSLTPAEREGLRALWIAAALRQGFRPIRGETEKQWTLRAARVPEGYRLTLEVRGGKDGGRTVQKVAHRESLFGYLERMIRAATRWGDERVLFMVLNPAGSDLVGWCEDRVYVDQNGALECWSVIEGQRLWQRPKPDRYRPQYGFRMERDESVILFQYQPNFERVHMETGAGTRGPGVSGRWSWSIVTGRNEQVFAAEGEEIKAVRGRKNEIVWIVRGPADWSAGPLTREGLVWAGNEAGEVHCWKDEDGREVWSTVEPVRWRGPLILEDDILIAASQEGRLTAFRAREGSVLWRADAADTLLVGGLCHERKGILIAADRSGRVGRLEITTGAWKGEWNAGEPAAGFGLVSESMAAWSGRKGRIVLLRLPDLTPLREIRLDVALRDGLIVAPESAAEWQTGESLTVARRTLVLVADDEGFLYAIPMP